MENFNIMWVHWKIHFLGGGSEVHKKKQYIGWNYLKGGFESLQI